MQLTRANHFQFGYDENKKWKVSYGAVTRPVQDWPSECVNTADEIFNSTKKPVYVCMSGGIDSELVAESFRRTRNPFRAAIMRFDHHLNEHDIKYAIKYCEKHQIPMEFFDIDPLEFYQSAEFEKIVDSTKCFYPMLALQMKLLSWVNEKGGFPVVGSAECFLEKQKDGTWRMYEREIYAGLYRYQNLHDIEGVAGFFQWNPENMLAYLMDPMLQALVKNKFPKAFSSLDIKPALYKQHFEITGRQKYYGWEKFDVEEARLRKILSKKYADFSQEAKLPYGKVIEMLSASNSGL